MRKLFSALLAGFGLLVATSASAGTVSMIWANGAGGVVAGIGGTQRLTRFVGKSKSMEMHLTGRFMDADEAERAGLVSRVVPAKKLMEEAAATAHKIAEKSVLTAMAVKEAEHAVSIAMVVCVVTPVAP